MTHLLPIAAALLLHGLATAAVLSLCATGMAVTLRLTGFPNYAHAVFATIGAHATILALNLAPGAAIPPAAAIVGSLAAFAIVSVLAAAAERVLIVRVYDATPRDRILFAAGLAIAAGALVRAIAGPDALPAPSPDQTRAAAGFQAPLTILAATLAIGVLLWLGVRRTRFGVQLRATLDNRRAAESMGVDTARVVTAVFALGAGLAAAGGVLGLTLENHLRTGILALDPASAARFMVYGPLAAAIGGADTWKGPIAGALSLGFADTADTWLLPGTGPLLVAAAGAVLLVWRPEGLLGRARPAARLAPAPPRLRPPSFRGTLVWAIAATAWFALDGQRPLASLVPVAVLFAMSLDLVMGFAGVATLGHAAFVGFGAIAASLFAARISPEPLMGLVAAVLATAAMGAATSLVAARAHGWTQPIPTLVLAMAAAAMGDGFAPPGTGCGIAPPAAALSGTAGPALSLIAAGAVWFGLRRLLAAPFGEALTAAEPPAAHRAAAWTIGAAIAGLAGGLLVQTAGFAGPDAFGPAASAEAALILAIGGIGRLHGAVVGAALWTIGLHHLAGPDPEFLDFWIGAGLATAVLSLPGGLMGTIEAFRAA